MLGVGVARKPVLNMQQKVAKVSSEITFGKCRVPDTPTPTIVSRGTHRMQTFPFVIVIVQPNIQHNWEGECG